MVDLVLESDKIARISHCIVLFKGYLSGRQIRLRLVSLIIAAI